MLLADATWKEIQALDKRTVVVVPFGAMEQHGLHLPMKTDAAVAGELVHRIDQKQKDSVLILPVQWIGYSPHHMKFGGSITLSAETYIKVGIEIVSSIVQAGFTNILLLNSHGGNRSILDIVANELKMQNPSVRFVTATYWNVARGQIQQIRESELGGLGHACEMETSMMLAAYPQTVRMELARPDGAWPCSQFQGQDMLMGSDVGVPSSFSEFTESGVNGNPLTANAEKGEMFLDAIADRLIELITEIQNGKLFEMKKVEG